MKMKRGLGIVCGFVLVLAIGSCGSSKVTLPNVTFTCSATSYCTGNPGAQAQPVVIYWTTEACTSITAVKDNFSAVQTVQATCGTGTCTKNAISSTYLNSSSVQVTKIKAGTYNVCVYIFAQDTDGNSTYTITTGDPVGTLSVNVADGVGDQDVTSFAAY